MEQSSGATITYRYPVKRLVGDYLRAGSGVAISGAILLFAEPAPWVLVIFAVILAIFLFFGLRTVKQHRTEVVLSDQGVLLHVFGAGKALKWSDLAAVRLRYYGSRRQRSQQQGGFLQLDLRGAGNKLSFESSLQGFRDLSWHAAKAAREQNAESDPSTASNFLAIGVSLEEETPRPIGEGYGHGAG
jgi:hypothetical protein|tara:strand:- start:3386 stop:3946 length:561 start_codon:yes stop_codon:yes gene_type:complete